jgi:ribonuclease HII
MENNTAIKAPRNKTGPLDICFHPKNRWEIGVDEAGRGPLFGRLYVAGTILPKEGYRHDLMKDSKRFSSQKKIREVANYIKENATAWTIKYAEPEMIDELNIRQAVLKMMRECCSDLIEQMRTKHPADVDVSRDFCLLIDGNDFPAFTTFDNVSETLVDVESHTVEGGDNKYTCIAAASILAKVARDDYIEELCAEFPQLDEWYGISSNKGYGAKRHMEGIKEHGITVWHRVSYGPCKIAPRIDIAKQQ